MENVKHATFGAISIISMAAVVLGVFMMFMAALKEFGWFALIGDVENVIAVKTLWTGYALYRIGFITEAIGIVVLILSKLLDK